MEIESLVKKAADVMVALEECTPEEAASLLNAVLRKKCWQQVALSIVWEEFAQPAGADKIIIDEEDDMVHAAIHINSKTQWDKIEWSNGENYMEVEVPEGEDPIAHMEKIEKESIMKALECNNHNRKKAAEELHISERSMYRKMKKYGLYKW